MDIQHSETKLFTLIFHQDNRTMKMNSQKGFDKHDKEFKVLTWPPNSLYFYWIEHLQDLHDKLVQPNETPPWKLKNLKC